MSKKLKSRLGKLIALLVLAVLGIILGQVMPYAEELGKAIPVLAANSWRSVLYQAADYRLDFLLGKIESLPTAEELIKDYGEK